MLMPWLPSHHAFASGAHHAVMWRMRMLELKYASASAGCWPPATPEHRTGRLWSIHPGISPSHTRGGSSSADDRGSSPSLCALASARLVRERLHRPNQPLVGWQWPWTPVLPISAFLRFYTVKGKHIFNINGGLRSRWEYVDASLLSDSSPLLM